jgi:hypothetical protein
MLGEGLIEMDWLLVLACALATIVQLYYLPSRCLVSPGIGFISIFRFIGWSILLGRYVYVMATTGDILISVGAWLGIMFLALGEIAVITNHGKKVDL